MFLTLNPHAHPIIAYYTHVCVANIRRVYAKISIQFYIGSDGESFLKYLVPS